jgi:X-Pro dipeptidyl-peptidase
MNRRPLLVVAVVWALSLALLPAAGAQEALPDLDAIDPVTHSYDDAIVEHVQVPSRDGVNQIWVDIIRPATEPGEPVPTIMMASPYFNTLGRGYLSELKTPHAGPSDPKIVRSALYGGGGTETPFPEWYDEYFVPRGYAFAAMDLRGTRNTSGCQTYGDRDEVFDAVDVIDWIADQEWSNGKVGMTGGSYDGTIAIGAAAEQPMSGRHPDALAAIIPIRAIDRWYDYAFVNGAQVQSQALVTPSLFTVALAADDTQSSAGSDLLFPVHVVERKACIATFGAAVSAGHASPYQDARSPFWRERDFVRSTGGFRAATFIIHGLYDITNVKTHNAGHLWEALNSDAPELPKKLWWYFGDHVDPKCPPGHVKGCNDSSYYLPNAFDEKFIEANHRWWLQFLKGVEAGATETPTVEVQRPDGSWDASQSYPVTGGDLVLNISPDQTLTTGTPEEGTLTYRDGQHGSGANSIVLETPPFAQDTRISGQIGFDLDLAATGPDTVVGVTVEVLESDLTKPVISYGAMRAYYRDTVNLRGRSTPTAGSFLEPDTRYDITFPSLHTDMVVPAGSVLKFTISPTAGATALFGSTSQPGTGGTVTLFTGADASRILIPTAPVG